MNNEFSGIDFALGSVRGTRAFDVDELGRLTGVALKQIWTPGENLAECRRADFEKSQRMLFFNPFYFGTSSEEEDRKVSEEAFRKIVGDRQHYAPSAFREATEKYLADQEEKKRVDSIIDCTHGFYGYYESSNDYGEADLRVNGVIEGYGEVVIGTRGFRASKARIVALHIPKKFKRNRRVLENYATIPFFESFDQMVREYPCDDGGMALSPQNTEDFWTREV